MSVLCVILVTNISNHLSQLYRKVKSYIQDFNLFPSVPPSTDEHQLRNEKISTRIFLYLLTLSLAILLLYNSLNNVTQTVNVKAPTMTKYLELYLTYSQTLKCPCKQISINYDTFLSIEYTFHQVCTSVFITQDWINFLNEEYYYGGDLYLDDYRLTSIFTFQALNTFCGLANQTTSIRLTQFYSTQYVSAFVIPSEIFDPQVQTLVEQFISSTTHDFSLSISTVRDTTQSNALFSSQQSNYEMYLLGGRGYAYTDPWSYGDCSCSLSATCIEQSSMFRSSNGRVLYSVPGMYTGCYTVESLLQSNLQCFYNQTCINKVVSYFVTRPLMNTTALNNSLPSQFLPNSTLKEVINQIMVEQFVPSIIYNSYYNACQPTECTYTYQTKNSIIYIVTTLIGLLGGLITVLKLIIPPVVMFIRKEKERSRPDIGKRYNNFLRVLYASLDANTSYFSNDILAKYFARV
ncbi:unnamed protein product [Adineta steineri]|uniref:Transmembrane protein n=1 Tax=Adineta steineri TaxID=433720 RepID=A0A815AQE8_9BILA|nr:unnamed protein product [Adineta steineri]